MEKVKHKAVTPGNYRLAVGESSTVIWPNGKSLEEIEAEFRRTMAEMRDALRAPGGRAWARIGELMHQAKADPAISDNAGAVDLLDVMERLTKYAWSHWDAEMVLAPVIESSAKQAVSDHQSKIATKKNAVARAWVLSEWEKRIDKGQSKNSFGKQHADLVKNRFDLKVEGGTIARDWLPKTQK